VGCKGRRRTCFGAELGFRSWCRTGRAGTSISRCRTLARRPALQVKCGYAAQARPYSLSSLRWDLSTSRCRMNLWVKCDPGASVRCSTVIHPR
jgi:hypothetical protein